VSRGADRPRLALRRPRGGDARDPAAAHEPRPPRLPRRRRHGGGPRAADARGRRGADAGARGRAREAVPAAPRAGSRRDGRQRRGGDTARGAAAGGRAGALGCRFPGCGLPLGQGHHIEHWAQGGPTTLSNLVTLCRRHHRAVHEEGYGVERRTDGEFAFTRPNGWPIPDVPGVVALQDDPVRAVQSWNAAAGVHVDARTACADWNGQRLDVGWAIDVLHPLARRPRGFATDAP
jgi:hypothetical protein